MEYTDYQLPLTDIEIANALKLINNLETGTASITVPKNTTGMFSQTVHFGKSHKNPKIYLQLTLKSAKPTPYYAFQPIVSNVTSTCFDISLIATNSPDAAHFKEIPSGTYYIDYFIING